MGTVVSFAVVSRGDADAVRLAIQESVQLLHAIDRQFSPYREDSEVSRIAVGSLRLDDASPSMRTVVALCAEVSRATNGYFTTSPAGRFDPSGLVKGWAVEQVSDLLVGQGFGDHVVSGGGDLQARGRRPSGEPWRAAIADPHHVGATVTTIALTDHALATSGTAERGDHVVNPHSGQPPTGHASVSVLGRHLTWVDAVATAVLAMGEDGLSWVEEQDALEAFAVLDDGSTRSTSGWDRASGASQDSER